MTNWKFAAPVKKRRAIRLSKEAFKMVEERAVEIAEALMNSTIEGKVMSTKLLVELAEGDLEIEDGATVGPLRSLALKLALAVQSKAKAPHAVAETETKTLQPAEA
jgi:hypothetical protein